MKIGPREPFRRGARLRILAARVQRRSRRARPHRRHQRRVRTASIGVMPPQRPWLRADVWRPIAPDLATSIAAITTPIVVGRLAPGESIAKAEAGSAHRRGASGRGVSEDEQRLERARGTARRHRPHRLDAALDDHPDGRGRIAAADCVRQRRQPDARPRHRPPPRDVDAASRWARRAGGSCVSC